jgi:hypothetical protein
MSGGVGVTCMRITIFGSSAGDAYACFVVIPRPAKKPFGLRPSGEVDRWIP